MKVYTCPTSLPEPEFDMDTAAYEEAIAEHTLALRKYIRAKGYTGQWSGEIYYEPVADSHAQYMVVHAPKGSGLESHLIHLSYWDGYGSRDIEFIPTREILRRVKMRNITIGKMTTV